MTGGRGFLGGHLTRRLAARGAGRVDALGRRDYDLTQMAEIERMLEDLRPDVVIHLAAVVGGIGANRRHPGRFFYDNLIMGAQLIEQARRRGVGKLVIVGTVCSYPENAPTPFREEDLWNGYPEPTNAPYGIAKLALLTQLQAYRRQYGTSGIYLLPVNLYGPGDSFDLESGHVIPALVRKCLEAKELGRQEVEVWGSGRATREFLYVDDAAEGILLATERYDGVEPVNLGSGEEISIADLVAAIARLTGFEGKLRWDRSRPDGQPRRRLDTTKARRLFGFEARTGLEEGLRRTIEWYLAGMSHRPVSVASSSPQSRS